MSKTVQYFLAFFVVCGVFFGIFAGARYAYQKGVAFYNDAKDTFEIAGKKSDEFMNKLLDGSIKDCNDPVFHDALKKSCKDEELAKLREILNERLGERENITKMGAHNISVKQNYSSSAYWEVKFTMTSSYRFDKNTIESFTWMKQDGEYKLLGFNIDSETLRAPAAQTKN